MSATPKTVQVDTSSNVSELKVDPDFLKISTPARIMIAGPTLSGKKSKYGSDKHSNILVSIGKSEFILKMVQFREQIFRGKFDRILFSHPR